MIDPTGDTPTKTMVELIMQTQNQPTISEHIEREKRWAREKAIYDVLEGLRSENDTQQLRAIVASVEAMLGADDKAVAANPYIEALSSDIDNDLDVLYQGRFSDTDLVTLRNRKIAEFKRDFPALGKLIFSQDRGAR